MKYKIINTTLSGLITMGIAAGIVAAAASASTRRRSRTT